MIYEHNYLTYFTNLNIQAFLFFKRVIRYQVKLKENFIEIMESPADRFVEDQLDNHLDLLMRTPTLIFELDQRKYSNFPPFS